jgi:hypothetical protein
LRPALSYLIAHHGYDRGAQVPFETFAPADHARRVGLGERRTTVGKQRLARAACAQVGLSACRVGRRKID